MNPPAREPLHRRAAWTAYVALQLPLQRRAPFRRPAAIERAQRRRVRRAVAHAYEHVPHYRETMDRLGLRPSDFASAADLAKLPLVERDDLQRDPERFLSRAQPRERYVQLATDGTSGRPVVVYHDAFALVQGATHTERREALVFRLAGRRLRLRRVFVGEQTGTIARTSSAFRDRTFAPARLRYRDVRLSMRDPLPATAERIGAFDADMLRAYGSWVEALFLHVERSGMPFRAPRVVVYGADSVSPPVRRLIGDTFGSTVLSEYGAGEAHHIGLECEHHRGLHLNEDLYPVRLVDAGGRDVPDGEPGDVVVSNLVNRATVLLNYRLGDRARRLPGPCPCGRTLPRLSLPEGRVDDWIEAPGGELVHAQEVRGLVLADDRWIRAFQIEQLGAARYAVSVVATADADRDALRGRLQERFAGRFGDRTTTDVTFVDALRRTPGGKVRVVTSRRS